MKRGITKHFRCTPAEAKAISRGAEQAGFKEAEYIRRKVCQGTPVFPVEIKRLLDELKIGTIRIGTNINQITHLCNAKGEVAYRNLRDLQWEMEKLNTQYEQIRKKLEDLGGGETWQ